MRSKSKYFLDGLTIGSTMIINNRKKSKKYPKIRKVVDKRIKIIKKVVIEVEVRGKRIRQITGVNKNGRKNNNNRKS